MKIAVCEDEQAFTQKLTAEIESFFSEKEIDTEFFCFSEGKALLDSTLSEYDAVFLDINLGAQRDGMELGAKIREKNEKVPLIFVTSLENRAVDGYDVQAFGFVVKKNLSEKLPRVLEKLYRELFCKRSVALTLKEGAEIVPADDILWAESCGRETLVHLTDRELCDLRSIKNFAAVLDGDDFVEVHKSIFVNVSRIRRINTDTVILSSGVSVPVSRRNRKNVMFAVMKKVGGK